MLMADKGMAVVVLDKLAYINKVQDLLADEDINRPIPGDTTSRQKVNLSKP